MQVVHLCQKCFRFFIGRSTTHGAPCRCINASGRYLGRRADVQVTFLGILQNKLSNYKIVLVTDVDYSGTLHLPQD